MTLTPHTDYNDGNWHGWNGEECPVHPNDVVSAIRRNSLGDREDIISGKRAGIIVWGGCSCPIKAFRVTQPYVEPRKPREFWLNEYPDFIVEYAYPTKEDADIGAGKSRVRCILMREVTEVSA